MLTAAYLFALAVGLLFGLKFATVFFFGAEILSGSLLPEILTAAAFVGACCLAMDVEGFLSSLQDPAQSLCQAYDSPDDAGKQKEFLLWSTQETWRRNA